MQKSEIDADKAEYDAHRGERKRDRITQQQHDYQRREHERRHIARDKGNHAGSPRWRRISAASISSALGSSRFSAGSEIRPSRNAMRLMSSDKPWSTSSRKPIGTSSRAGQMMSPPALVETSLR